ncbi:MAG TPA: hypothetical protein VF928_11950 [Usitatibacteraceae bacterium]
MITQISKARFDAYVSWTRLPIAPVFSSEIAWYAGEAERVLGAVVLDHSDMDFGYVILGRDESGRFRCIDVAVSIPNPNIADAELKQKLQKLSDEGASVFPQGGSTKGGVDLFTPIVPEEKQHPNFKLFQRHPNWSPAIGVLREMMRNFDDVDGNFVEQFQSSGFDARLWELYLYAYLIEEGLYVEKPKPAPDFLVRGSSEVTIEAVTVQPSAGDPPPLPVEGPPNFKEPEEIRKLLRGKMPIKFGSALYSKLTRKPPYWELPAAKGKPFIFAIADFHEQQSMLWSSTALFEYLFGLTHEFSRDDDGKLHISSLKIESHEHKGKKIPSGFFHLEATKNVSAVLFSSSGTISKFNRMGRLAGFGIENLRLVRSGLCYDHDPNAALPKPFFIEVEAGKFHETWGEGLELFHNPNAVYPVPEEMFTSIAHHKFIDDEIRSSLPEFHPFSSVTYNFLLT